MLNDKVYIFMEHEMGIIQIYDRGTEYLRQVKLMIRINTWVTILSIQKQKLAIRKPTYFAKDSKKLCHEFYQLLSEKRSINLGENTDGLDEWISLYYDRTPTGKMCCGRTHGDLL